MGKGPYYKKECQGINVDNVVPHGIIVSVALGVHYGMVFYRTA